MPGKKGAAHSLVYGGLFALASLGWVGPALAADAPAGTANPASAPDAAIAARLRERTSGALRKFYAGQDYRPLWISRGKVGPEAQTLLSYLESARLDGLKPSRYPVEKLRERLAATRGGGAEALARAEIDLSDAFARYVRDMRKPGKVRMEYAERGLKPGKLGAETVLRAAA
ncbi:MAG: L,D-transpeptidase, partial [Novosphingobium sp.]